MRCRLKNLLYLTAVVAIVVSAWYWLVRGNVAEIEFERRGVRVWMSDAWHRWADQPYYNDESGELVDPLTEHPWYDFTVENNVFLRWWEIATFIAALLALAVTMHVLVRVKRRNADLQSKQVP